MPGGYAGQTGYGGSGSLSGEQVAQIAYQAGFRGDALWKIVAISKRESGWNPGAYNGNTGTGDNSWGLLQINTLGNLGPHIDQLIAQAGGNGRQSLNDPLVNLKVGYLMSAGGTNWNPWGPYKGVSELTGTNPSEAQAAVQRAGASGVLGQDWNSGSSAPSAQYAGQPTGSTTQAPAGKPVSSKPPSDGRLITNPYDGKNYLFYQAGQGVWFMYDVGAGVDTSGFQAETPSHEDWKNTWDPVQPVHAGDASELANVQSTYGSFSGFIDSLMTQVLGKNNPARSDPSVIKVIAQYAARPDMTPAELQNLLQATDWYAKNTQSQLEWNGLSPAEQQKRMADTASRMADTWMEYGGLPVDTNDPRISNYVQQVASGQMGYGAFTEVVKSAASQDPNSKYSRQTRDEERARKQDGIDIENTSQHVRDLAYQWGIPMSMQGAMDWAGKIVNKDASDQDLLDNLKQQAQVLYPWKDPNMDTTTAAQPWIQTYQRVMEKNGDIQNPYIQKALTAGQPVFDFEQDLKRTDSWLGTKNGTNEIATRASTLGAKMGFS